MQEPLNIGIDVAKAELAVGVIDHPELNATLANTAVAITRWLRHVPHDARLAVESTGRYHRLLVDLAQAQGLETYVLNACDVHFYAKALGLRGKTDRTDAQVISRYLREHHPYLHPFCAGSQADQRITVLLRRRAQLVGQRAALRQSLHDVPLLAAQLKTLVAQFDRVIATIDKHIAQQTQSEPTLAAETRRLRTIPGVGAQGATMLSCLFRRIEFKNVDALIAFTGLDPRPMDSGQKRGLRRLSKRGAPWLRRQLYMMGFSASHSNVFQSRYDALRARGLSATAAFVILGRKLLTIAFALWRSKKSFDSNYFLLKKA
jgi:transposase